eukprot:231626-Prymnesium_polylepis.1
MLKGARGERGERDTQNRDTSAQFRLDQARPYVRAESVGLATVSSVRVHETVMKRELKLDLAGRTRAVGRGLGEGLSVSVSVS